ncbi:MAG: glutamate synthase [Bacillota bacterium]
MVIDAKGIYYKDLNKMIKECKDKDIVITNCLGQRYIGTGVLGKNITIIGTAGNASGAYLEKTNIRIKGNAQDAIGDTMNDGSIVVEGSSGDATGYGARGGKIYIKGDAGYRAGIHMKAYKNKRPVLIIGGQAGSFLGEYQAGGYIAALNLEEKKEYPFGPFCATGMHGGMMFIRTEKNLELNNPMLITREADEEDMKKIKPYLEEYCELLGVDKKIIDDKYQIIIPNTKNPYKQLYTYN